VIATEVEIEALKEIEVEKEGKVEIKSDDVSIVVNVEVKTETKNEAVGEKIEIENLEVAIRSEKNAIGVNAKKKDVVLDPIQKLKILPKNETI